MLFGTYMGGYWILKFVFFPLGLSIPFLSLLFMGVTICVPFMGYYYARIYRNTACGGSIGFLHGWVFTLSMYVFASLLTAVAHYIYFRFIDQGYIVGIYREQIQMLTSGQVPGMEQYADTLRNALATLESLTPTDITLQLLSWNIFCGSLLAIPTALFVMRRRPQGTQPAESTEADTTSAA